MTMSGPTLTRLGWIDCGIVSVIIIFSAVAGSARAQTRIADDNERVVVTEAFKVRAGPMENFGFQVQRVRHAGRRVLAIAISVAESSSTAVSRPPEVRIR